MSVKEGLKDEPMVNLGSDHDEYPEIESGEEEEVDSKEVEVEIEPEIEAEDEGKGRVIIVDGQASVEVQDLKNKVVLLEEMWKMEKALRELTEERNELKAQINRMGVECSVSTEVLNKKKKKNNKRKWNDNQTSGGSKSGGEVRKVKSCEKCGRNHSGECLKGKGVCYNCKQEGHISPQCPKPKKGGCFSCGEGGHKAKNCSKKKIGGGSGQKKN